MVRISRLEIQTTLNAKLKEASPREKGRGLGLPIRPLEPRPWSSRRHESHKRNRSRSPSFRQNLVSIMEDQNDHLPPKSRKGDEPLQTTLNSIETLLKGLDSLDSCSLYRKFIPSVSDVH